MDADDAPSPNDTVRPWPSAQLDAIDRMRDAELAEFLNKTEFMIVRFYLKGHLTLRLGQLLFDMLRHPDFNLTEVRSDSIVKLLLSCMDNSSVHLQKLQCRFTTCGSNRGT